VTVHLIARDYSHPSGPAVSATIARFEAALGGSLDFGQESVVTERPADALGCAQARALRHPEKSTLTPLLSDPTSLLLLPPLGSFLDGPIRPKTNAPRNSAPIDLGSFLLSEKKEAIDCSTAKQSSAEKARRKAG
jgi:hypothetical protein